MHILGVTWMTMLHQYEYLYERFPVSGMTRNGLKYFLKQQETKGIDIFIVFGKAIVKYNQHVSVKEDTGFIPLPASRSIFQVQITIYIMVQ